MEYKDYYEVLGVPKTATQAEIKKAYRRLARELHPDRNPGDKTAEQKFKEANEAHAVLSDPEKRKRYDELGANWQAYQQYGGANAQDWAGGFGGAGPFASGPGGVRYTYRTVTPDEMSGFSDFFRAFFGDEGFSFSGGAGSAGSAGGTGATTRSSAPRSGRSGGAYEQVFDFGDLLGRDARSGAGPSAGTATADRVRLAGADLHADAEVTLAEVARGAERMVDVEGRRLQIKIPPGVRDGARIKLRGAGLPGAGGAPAGDLYVSVHVQSDPRFEREGANLRTELPITLLEAIGGAEVPVETPTGTLKLRIRPNTQNGQEIHLAGKGLPKPGRDAGRGDLMVRVRLVLPHLDDETRDEIATQLAKHPQPDPRARRRSH